MTDELNEFRLETRAWIEAHCPASMRTPIASDADQVWGGQRGVFPSEDARIWLERMADRGWTAPTWPREYGGGGLTKPQAKVLLEELFALGCRRPLESLGIWMLGPALLQFGDDAQKRRFLPRMTRGEDRWCQGFSEPGAGSDLAGLQARAVRDGDHFVVNGQKVWTSHANHADWMFALVRTDPDAPKHDGITFLLIDMRSPGLSVRPIQLISGASPFCETFFNDVRVPLENIVGRLNGGWEVARAVLQFERTAISSLNAQPQPDGSDDLVGLARRYLQSERGPLPEPILRDHLARMLMDARSFSLTVQRSAEAAKAGRPPGSESSILKLYASELKQRRRDLMARVAGFQGVGWEGEGFSPVELDLTRQWLRTRASTIEGGTSEIQLNIIARRVLGLPE